MVNHARNSGMLVPPHPDNHPSLANLFSGHNCVRICATVRYFGAMKLALPLVSLVLLVFLAPLSAKEKPPAPANGQVIALEPFKVQGTAASNFGIDIRILVDVRTKKVFKIVITRVAEDSDASDLGLQVGDEIVKIDGLLVQGMDPKIDTTSQIGRIFLNRHPGDQLKLEVITRRPQKITLRALKGS